MICMQAQSDAYAVENRYLRRCVNDLLSLHAVHALWSGYGPLKIVQSLADTLLNMLDLDLVYARLVGSDAQEPIEVIKIARPQQSKTPQQIGKLLGSHANGDSPNLPRRIPSPLGDGEITLLTCPLGLRGQIGVVIAGSQRATFAGDTERLLLNVAANQASIGLEEARFLEAQKRLAVELDRRVALRTEELAAVNRELTNEVVTRKRIEERLLKSEALLKKSEADLRQALDTIPVIAWCNLPDGANEFLNRVWREYTGLSEEESIGWGWQVRFHPEDLVGLLFKWREMLISGEPGDIEARILRHDGVYRWFLIRAEPLRDESGNVVRWYGTSTDINDRKLAEEQLRRSEAFLAEGQYLSRTGSFAWRVATDEIVWSEQLYRIFEFEPGTPITLDLIATRIHPEDARIFNDMIERVRDGTGQLALEHRLLLPDHSVKYLHLTAHASRDPEGLLEFIGAVQDVTQRRASDEALANARQELAKVARMTSLGVLTASVAHEVNQPLSGIMTNASTCLRMLSSDPPNLEGARETARRTIRDGNRASDVITRLRTLYSKKDPCFELLDLNDAAREVAALLLNELQRKRVVMRQHLAEQMPLVMGDRVQLQQVIVNLLRNASDAMANVDDRPRNLLVATAREEGHCVRLSVKDAGIGFEPDAADRLFQAFYTTKHDGMGIGLSVSRSIIEAHQGRLWATANEDAGATFSFVIPIYSENANEAGAAKPEPGTT